MAIERYEVMPSLRDKEGTFNSAINGKKSPAVKRKIGSSEGTSKQEASWEDVPVEYVQLLVKNITAAGGAVTFGRTRDRGALTITPLHDDFERETHYVRPLSAEGFALMIEIYDVFAELAGNRKWE